MDKVLNLPRLRAWRAANSVTLEELSDLTGWSIPTLSRLERGERSIDALSRIRMARILGCRVRDLFPTSRDTVSA